MFLIDFTDHRIICITISLAIAVVALSTIFIKYLLRERKHKKQKEIETE